MRAPIAPHETASADVLRRDRVEELAADGKAGVEHAEQHTPREVQSGVDVARAVEMRVVDQPLPARCGPWLLEVDAHRDQQLAAQIAGELREQRRVLERRVGIVHAARPDDGEQPDVGPIQDGADLAAATDHDVRLLAAQGQLLEQRIGREQRHDPFDPHVADVVGRSQLGTG